MAGITMGRVAEGSVAATAAALLPADYIFWREQQGEYMERRQLFLRSYRFCRKQPPQWERARRFLLRVRRLFCARLRLLWAKIRGAGRRRHRLRLLLQTCSPQPQQLAAGAVMDL